MTKCFVSSQSEHGWRASINGLSRNGWNVLGRTFLWQDFWYQIIRNRSRL
jgi:hypothetical protein